MVFVDTGAWFAKFVPDDPNHARIEAWFSRNNQPVLTLDYCIDETLTLLAARNRLTRALVAGRFFFQDNFVQVHFVSADQIHRA